jgi:hypothetical protein
MKVVVATVALGLGIAWIRYDRDSAKLLIPLLTAGGLASVVQGLIEHKNVLVLPKRVDAGHYDLGFVGDTLIGMVGAFASLIVGLAVLNDRYRTRWKSTAARPNSSACSPRPPAIGIKTWSRASGPPLPPPFNRALLLPHRSTGSSPT